MKIVTVLILIYNGETSNNIRISTLYIPSDSIYHGLPCKIDEDEESHIEANFIHPIQSFLILRFVYACTWRKVLSGLMHATSHRQLSASSSFSSCFTYCLYFFLFFAPAAHGLHLPSASLRSANLCPRTAQACVCVVTLPCRVNK